MTSKWPPYYLAPNYDWTHHVWIASYGYKAIANQNLPHLTPNELVSKICVHPERSISWGSLYPSFKNITCSMRKEIKFWDFHKKNLYWPQMTFDLHFLFVKSCPTPTDHCAQLSSKSSKNECLKAHWTIVDRQDR